MRADRILIALLLSFLPVVALASSAQATRLNLPPVEHFTLENGLEVQIVRHPTVPIVALELWIEAGAVDDPEGEEGLASVTADALRKGAGEYDAGEFAAAIDGLGARFSASVDVERTRVHLDLQSRDLEQGLSLVADAVLRPRLENDEILRLRDQAAEGIKSAKENPRNVLGDYHRAHLFQGHPYGSAVEGTEISLPTIDPAAVRAFHRGHYTADRARLTVVGDLDVSAASAMVESIFGEMPRGELPHTVVEPALAPAAARVLIINKNDTPQTWFQIGGIGPSWKDLDDYAATEIVRTIFGGRFTSWLNSKLRIESGLTYGAGYSIWRAGAAGGSWISTFTATETTRETIELALAELDRLHEEGLSESDLASAKAYLQGQLPYRYETATDIAAQLAKMDWYGIDRSFVDDLFEHIDAVSLEDCRAAVDRWFPRENLVFTAIGVRAEIEPILAEFGPVRVRENSSPGFRPDAED